MDKTLSIDRRILGPHVGIGVIFNSNSSGKYTKDAELYQDILEYSISKNDGFKFTELGQWLLDHNNEIVTYYSDFRKKVSRAARIANRRQRIQHCLDNLIQFDLIYQKATIKSSKNQEETPLYALTKEGNFLSLILRCITKRENTHIHLVEQSKNELLKLLHSYTSNDSPVLMFINNFFTICNENGIFALIINHFVRRILKGSKVHTPKDLLLLFLGIRHSLNWLVIHPIIFNETLNKLDAGSKKIMYFQFKMEIEEYYYENYLLEEWKRRRLLKNLWPSNYLTDFSDIVAIPGKDWQLMRHENIHDELIVTIPGYCNECKSDRPFLFKTENYLEHLILAHRADPVDTIGGDCTVCGNKYSIFANVMKLPWFLDIWQSPMSKES